MDGIFFLDRLFQYFSCGQLVQPHGVERITGLTPVGSTKIHLVPNHEFDVSLIDNFEICWAQC